MINQTKISVAILGILTAVFFGVGLGSQSALAQEVTSPGASFFAPGIRVLTDPDLQSASDNSPGTLEKVVQGKLPGGGCIASSFSPGNLFTQEPTTTDTSP